MTNTGDTTLTDILVDDGDLGITEADMVELAGGPGSAASLGAGQTVVFYYQTTIDGQRLHFVHQRSRNPDALLFPYECDPDSFFRQLYEEGRMQEYIDRAPRRL